MDTRNSLLSAVVVFVVVAGGIGGGFPVFAGPVHTYPGDFNLPILDEPGSGVEMTEAVIKVPDHFTISDLDVGINLTHTNVFDLQIFLQSPAGTRICLNMYDFKKEFFEGRNYTNTIFDDEAPVSIRQAKSPFTGRFKPIEPYELSKFDNEDIYGPWRLQIYDMFDYDTGTLDSFELMITVPDPATVMFLVFGIGLIYLRPPHRNHHSR